MKNSDRFLIAIVIGALVVAGAATALTLTHRSQLSYRGEAAPEDVAYNYLLALQKQEFERAYSYLAPDLPAYPRSVEQFLTEIGRSYPDDAQNSIIEVKPTMVSGDLATVDVRETTFYTGGLFNSGENTSSYQMILKLTGSGWRITDGGRHWSGLWQGLQRLDKPNG